MSRQIDSPSPVPFSLGLVVKNGSKILQSYEGYEKKKDQNHEPHGDMDLAADRKKADYERQQSWHAEKIKCRQDGGKSGSTHHHPADNKSDKHLMAYRRRWKEKYGR